MSEPATVQQALQRFLVTAPSDPRKRQVSHHLMACRTEAMGGRVLWTSPSTVSTPAPHFEACS